MSSWLVCSLQAMSMVANRCRICYKIFLARCLWTKAISPKICLLSCFAKQIELIIGIRKSMENQLIPLSDKVLLRKRAFIETVTDQLKDIFQSEPSQHRSFINFLVNLLAGLLAYCFQAKKPSLHLDPMLTAIIA